MRQTVHYVQIDVTSFQNARYFAMVRKHGSKFVAIHLECLKAMCASSVLELCAIDICDNLKHNLSFMLGESFDDVSLVLSDMIKNELLVLDDNTGKYYSRGFMNRVGKMLIANEERSRKQKENQRKKKLEKVDNG